MTVDPASFRDKDIEAVYHGQRSCFQTSKGPTIDLPVDAHHILGRSLDGDRLAASSILNLTWLRRDIHEGPLRDHPDQQRVYLRVALEHVLAAATAGRYGWNDADRAFMAYIAEHQPEFAGLYEGLNDEFSAIARRGRDTNAAFLGE